MTVQILIGDVREKLKELPDESVHCVVTSPPYWGLRDYGTALWDGGAVDCDHMQVNDKRICKQTENRGTRHMQFWRLCGKCSARRIDQQLGLERTLGEHIATMADLFDDVRRVLRKDGTLWLNYGDSYAGGGHGGGGSFDAERNWRSGNPEKNGGDGLGRVTGLKPKDLCGVPWRVAFALQERGWWLRQDIIWHKPNPMPESIKDRCTKAHEYIFLLSKSARYYFDAEAISEAAAYGTDMGLLRGKQSMIDAKVAWTAPSIAKRQEAGVDSRTAGDGTRNRRSVWTIATAPFSEAHFATFPPELPELCIKAGTSQKGCCAACGAPWVRDVVDSPEYQTFKDNERERKCGGMRSNDLETNGLTVGSSNKSVSASRITTGWSPSCHCNAAVVPGTILDCFGGAGTTGLVADRLQRHAILIELNPEYAAMAERRIRGDRGGLLDLMEAAE